MRPEPPTRERLRTRALRYLERYPASRGRLARVLNRRALREARALDLDEAAVAEAVEAVVAELAAQGLVDDAAYAEGRARALLRKGRTTARIRRELAFDGVEAEIVDGVVGRHAATAGDLDAAAAVRYARRRGLGPFRAPEDRAARREPDLRALLRQGFPYRIARRLIDASGPDGLDDPLA